VAGDVRERRAEKAVARSEMVIEEREGLVRRKCGESSPVRDR
jgi:hypothetical protein